MTETNKQAGSPLIQWGAIIGLGILNLIIFRTHYFGRDCFPWDFWKTYYAIIPFWTTAVSQHVLPEWVPFSGMGFPFFINLQSSFFYPPLWLFVAPGIHYTLHAAVTMQSLHVLWGACGAFVLLRVLTEDWRSALFGALAYQFFGGFYCNAEHMDIVRAYAWLPWLFWAATVRGSLQVRNFLLPGIFYCVATASYPGNLISHSFFLGIYIVFGQRSPDSNLKNTLILVGLLGVGILMSVVALGPAFLLRNQLTRGNEIVAAGPWPINNWLSVIAPWASGRAMIRGYFPDVSMISAFVGVPALVLIILIPKAVAKAFGVWWVLLICALALAQGSISMLRQMAVTILPVLGLSRMASSDYRGLIGLALIVLAAASLSAFLASTQNDRRQLVRQRLKSLCLIPVIVMSGIFVVFLPAQEFFWLLIIWAATVIALYIQLPNVKYSQWYLLAALCLLTVVGGLHVVSVSALTWTAQGTDIDALYKRKVGFRTSKWPLPVTEKINGVTSRSNRIDRKRADFGWSGYLDGTYQMADWGNTVLEASAKLETDQALRRYMLEPLRPLVFPNVQNVSLDMVRGQLEQGASGVFEQQNAVTPVKYGLNDIVYHVTLRTDAVLVENEIWFPGWEGKLERDAKPTEKILATSVGNSLRAWRLPAGQYTLVTRFKTPYLRACAMVSLTGLLLYLGLLAIFYRNWKMQRRILDR
ncbi:MAG TPA: hypothetical protein VFA61_10235 [Candidatus Udaeobacter sp.]|nr:hypothetical protein [Candidatus Udaeobacter sp.]